MARSRKGNASVTLTIRMTREDRELLNRLVAKRAIELSDEGLDVTATSVIRGMIRREARGLGLLPPLGRSPALGTPPPARMRSPRAEGAQSSSGSDGPSPSDPYGIRHATPPRLPTCGTLPLVIPTPMVPTGMGEPRELRPYVVESVPDSEEAEEAWDIDEEQVRERAVRAIRARKFRQRDLVERAGVPQQSVSRFLLGAESSDAQVRAIAKALEELDV